MSCNNAWVQLFEAQINIQYKRSNSPAHQNLLLYIHVIQLTMALQRQEPVSILRNAVCLSLLLVLTWMYSPSCCNTVRFTIGTIWKPIASQSDPHCTKRRRRRRLRLSTAPESIFLWWRWSSSITNIWTSIGATSDWKGCEIWLFTQERRKEKGNLTLGLIHTFSNADFFLF